MLLKTPPSFTPLLGGVKADAVLIRFYIHISGISGVENSIVTFIQLRNEWNGQEDTNDK